MRKIIILGSSGSIGQTAIRTIKEKKLDFSVQALVAFSSRSIIADAEYFSCPYLLTEGKSIDEIRTFLSSIDADIALNGVSGSDGLIFSSILIELGIDIALANKETVVLGGEFIFKEAERRNVRIIPVDSEHSALYNLINGYKSDVKSLIITASGGPFVDRKDLENVTVEEALHHPTWKMGRKITIDSASLANKGLEVIEAGYLFNFDASDIHVTVHRQSIVHSLIELHNGAIYAQLSPPDMALPIISALSDGILELNEIVRPLDFSNLTLTFEKWDKKRFPMLGLAYDALERKRAYPIAYNIADEVAVNAFLENRISFTDIAYVVKKTMDDDFSFPVPSINEAQDEIKRARRIAEEIVRDDLSRL